MKKYGFTLDEIYNLSIPQITLYLKEMVRLERDDAVLTSDMTRMAMHADAKQYSKAIKRMRNNG